MNETIKRKCCGDCRNGKLGANHACHRRLDAEQLKNQALNSEQEEI